MWLPRPLRRSTARRRSRKHVSQNDYRRVRVGWLNVRSLSNKTAAVYETVVDRSLDMIALTEVRRQTSTDICLRDAHLRRDTASPDHTHTHTHTHTHKHQLFSCSASRGSTTRLVRSWKTVDGTVLRQAVADSLLGQRPPPDASPDDLFALYTIRHVVKLRIFRHRSTLCAPSSDVSVRRSTPTVA